MFEKRERDRKLGWAGGQARLELSVLLTVTQTLRADATRDEVVIDALQ